LTQNLIISGDKPFYQPIFSTMKLQSPTGFVGILTLCLGYYPAIAQAQITPDATLGAELSQLTPNVVIQGGNADRIDGGAQRGGNLFHSFSQFNIADGQRVYFANPTGVQNILTRVTGGRSAILGTLGVNGTANLFLLNPNGIIFGPNAQLDVRGSFVGTTASGVQFGDQGSFTVNQTDAPPLLTIQPAALAFTAESTGSIVSNSVAAAGTSPSGRNLLGLQVPTGQSLILAAGDVRVDGGGINGGLNAQGGRIELGGLVGSGSIGLDNTTSQPKLVFPSEGTRGNVALVNNARVAVRGNGGGDVAVNADVFTATDGGRIVAGPEGAGNAGDINVNANVMNFSGESLDGIGSPSGLYNQVFTTATGRGGAIKVNTNQLTLNLGAQIDTSTFGQGDGGDISINARDFVLMDGMTQLPTSTNITGTGANIQNDPNAMRVVQGGKTQITTKSLTLLNGAKLTSSNYGKGNGGDISVNAETVTLQGQRKTDDEKISSGLESEVGRKAIGNAGNISIQTDTLNILDGASIIGFTRGRGNAANVKIVAKDSVLLSNNYSFIASGVEAEGVGQGGNIQIQASSLTLANGTFIDSVMSGQGTGGSILIDVANLSFERQGDSLPLNRLSGSIKTTLFGTGKAGGITIKARDRIFIDKGLIGSDVSDGGTKYPDFRGKGEGGAVQISSKDIYLNNAIISADSTGEGNAGSVSVVAANSLRLENNSSISSNVSSFNGSKGIGNGGKVLLNAPSIFITGSSIGSSTASLGNAGDVIINADKEVIVDGISRGSADISTVVFNGGVGRGGDVTITTPSLSFLNNGYILAGTYGVGDSGNVKITAGKMLLDKGNIYTNTGGVGNAGNIALDVGQVVLRNKSNLSSGVYTSEKFPNSRGNGGNISVKSNTVTLSGGSQLNSSTYASGRAGDIQIDATDAISLIGMDADNVWRSGIFSIVNSTGKGRGGDIKVTTGTLKITDDAAISASTFGEGRAGDIRVNADRSISISGTDRFADSSGLYTVSRGDSPAGDIFVTTPRLTLNNRAGLKTQSNANNGGNINVNSDLVLLRRNSEISTTAGLTQSAGNGGNINLFSNVIVAVAKENSDITANAFSGSGGTVNIQTNGLFGIAPRPKPTPLSDITASSDRGVQGTIAITQPDIRPEQGLLQLPGDILDASNQIGQSCPNARNSRPVGQFIVTGRGSLPISPLDPLADNPNLPALAELTQADRSIASDRSTASAQTPTAAPIVEAQGWQKTGDGKVILLAQPIVPTSVAPLSRIANAPNAFACVAMTPK
jgi:filamentous hemagglutinin family protein